MLTPVTNQGEKFEKLAGKKTETKQKSFLMSSPDETTATKAIQFYRKVRRMKLSPDYETFENLVTQNEYTFEMEVAKELSDVLEDLQEIQSHLRSAKALYVNTCQEIGNRLLTMKSNFPASNVLGRVDGSEVTVEHLIGLDNLLRSVPPPAIVNWDRKHHATALLVARVVFELRQKHAQTWDLYHEKCRDLYVRQDKQSLKRTLLKK